VNALLAGGADVDTGTDYGETPLLVATRGGHDAVVKMLLAAGATKITEHKGDADVLRAWRAECRALQELWDVSASAITWEGLTFNVDGRVVKVELARKLGDAEDVPAALGGLGALKELDLSGNKLTSVPEELGGLGAV
jgi:ankyrin repeat protein